MSGLSAKFELLREFRHHTGSAIPRCVLEYGDAARLRLVDFHVIADDGVGDFFREASLQSVEHFVGELRASVEGGHDHGDVQVRMLVAVANRRDGSYQFCASIHCEKCERDRDNNLDGCP